MRMPVSGASGAIAIVLTIAAGLSTQDPMDGTWGLDVPASNIRPRPGTQK